MFQEITKDEKAGILPILKDFTLEEIHSIKKSRKANVNVIYFVETLQGNYILRKSNPKTTVQQLAFEAEVLEFLKQKKFTFAPTVIQTKTKQEFVLKDGLYYRLFSFLEGKSHLDWNSRNFHVEEYVSQFQFMAQIHSYLKDLQPERTTDAPDVLTFLGTFSNELASYEKVVEEKNCAFSKHMLQEIPFLKKTTQDCLISLTHEKYDTLPKQVIHGDIHFGNLLFTNFDVSGIVDFDWCGVETPFWDFAYCFSQNGTVWGGENDAALDFSLFNRAIESYFGTREISTKELRLLQILIKIGDLRAVKWEINSYYDLGEEEKYTKFLQHTIRTLHMDQYYLLGGKI